MTKAGELKEAWENKKLIKPKSVAALKANKEVLEGILAEKGSRDISGASPEHKLLCQALIYEILNIEHILKLKDEESSKTKVALSPEKANNTFCLWEEDGKQMNVKCSDIDGVLGSDDTITHSFKSNYYKWQDAFNNKTIKKCRLNGQELVFENFQYDSKNHIFFKTAGGNTLGGTTDEDRAEIYKGESGKLNSYLKWLPDSQLKIEPIDPSNNAVVGYKPVPDLRYGSNIWLFTDEGDKNKTLEKLVFSENASKDVDCSIFSNVFKKQPSCLAAEKNGANFDPNTPSVNDNGFQLTFKGSFHMLVNTIIVLLIGAGACASWVNTFKIKYAFEGKAEDALNDNKNTTKKKTLECTNMDSFPYFSTADPGKCDPQILENYVQFPNINWFEGRFYSFIEASKKLIKSKKSYGDEYKGDGMEKAYIEERVIPTLKKNIKNYDEKILYHFYKKNIDTKGEPFIEELTSWDSKKFVDPKTIPNKVKEALKQGLGVWSGDETGQTNDPYDIEMAEKLAALLSKPKKEESTSGLSSSLKAAAAANMGVPPGMGGPLSMNGGDGDGNDDDDDADPEMMKLESLFKKMVKERDNLKKKVSKGFIDKNIAIPGNKWAGPASGQTFKKKMLSLAGLCLLKTMVLWRLFTNFYIKDFLTKFTHDPESKKKSKTALSFFIHFLVGNPFSALAIAGAMSALCTTLGMLLGTVEWVSKMASTKYLRRVSGGGNTIKYILSQIATFIGTFISGIIGIILASIILPIFATFILPFHHLYSLYRGAKKIKCPNISISKVIMKNLFTGITGTSMVLLAIIFVILSTMALTVYIPCHGNPGLKDIATYQNDRKDQAMVALIVAVLMVLFVKKQLSI